jgi:hypothetical protein
MAKAKVGACRPAKRNPRQTESGTAKKAAAHGRQVEAALARLSGLLEQA